MLSTEGLTATTSCSICCREGIPFADAGAMGPSSEMSSGVIWVRVVS